MPLIFPQDASTLRQGKKKKFVFKCVSHLEMLGEIFWNLRAPGAVPAPDWRGFHPFWFHFPFFSFPLGSSCKVTPTPRGCLGIFDPFFCAMGALIDVESELGELDFIAL